MGKESDQWQQIVSSYQGAGEVKWESVGGINPVDGPVALCVGGSNRLTGQLAPDFWGASCDADEEEVGGFMRRSVVPTAILAKAHMPDLAKVVSAFNVESIEANAGEFVKQKVSRRKVEFESLEFNQRFLATVPEDHDPVALRELFSPGFLSWTTTIDREVDLRVAVKALVNVGSVGQPRDEDPRACYALWDTDTGRMTLRRIEYDIEREAERIRRAGLPAILADRLFLGI